MNNITSNYNTVFIPDASQKAIRENPTSGSPQNLPQEDQFQTSSKELHPAFFKPVFETASAQAAGSAGLSLLAETAQETALSTALSMSASPASQAALSTVKILYTNDIHGAILPVPDKDNPAVQNGGVSYLASMVKDIRQEGEALVMDGGDWAQGTYLGGFDQGQTMIKVMNAIGYDSTVIGNHDFDWGRPALDKMMEEADFHVLGANIIDTGSNKVMDGVTPYFVKEVNGVKIGVVGVTSERTKSETAAPNTEGLKFNSVAQTVRQAIPELKKQGAELIVVSSHQGLQNDERLAKEVKGIDVIVGAHSHTRLNDGKMVGNTLVVQAGAKSSHLGELELQVDKNTGKIVNYTNTLKPVSSETSRPDAEVEAVLAPLMEEADKIMNEVIGDTSIKLTRDRRKTPETILGNMITDGMRQAVNADLAFVNSGGVRAEIDAGPITFGEVYQVVPFDQQMVTMDLSGAQIKQLLEASAERQRGTLEVSGLTVDIDKRKPIGSRISNLKIQGEPVDSKKLYKVAVDDFFAAGGNGYSTFLEGKNVEQHSITSRDAFKDFVTANSPFSEKNARVEGRMNMLGSRETEES